MTPNPPKTMNTLPAPSFSDDIVRRLASLLAPGETVRPIPTTSRYVASSTGDVISLVGAEPIRMKGSDHPKGYLAVELWIDRERQPLLVHRVVALAFYGQPPIDALGRTYQVHHRNGDRRDNRPENLAYIAGREHSRLTARSPGGVAKLTTTAVAAARVQAAVEGFASAVDSLVQEFEVSRRTARNAVAGRTWGDVPFPNGLTQSEWAAALRPSSSPTNRRLAA